ncbi:MAG TPA: SDR family oxidoreductase [Longimicrobium sp.]|nr:SDR family oxidoreductase [Longimicrobium sp.]
MEISRVRAVVTGAASGIGRCLALELARGGAAVMAGDINEAGLRTLEHEAAGLPGSLSTAAVDVSQEPSARGFVEEAARRLGGINLLVNNAAVLLDGRLVTPDEGWVKKLPLAQWKRVLDTNLTGSFVTAREAAAAMLENGGGPGLIVNLSSVFRWGNEGQTAYAASKGGLDAMTRSWAMELAPHGIRVAGIAPGLIDTPILDNIDPDVRASLVGRIPARRIGRPEEIWLALRFIIECEYFNGSILEVDGGLGM